MFETLVDAELAKPADAAAHPGAEDQRAEDQRAEDQDAEDQLAADLQAWARQLLDVDPGAVLAGAVEDAEPAGLDEDGLLALIQGCERLGSWARARQIAAIADLARRNVVTPDGRLICTGVEAAPDEVAAALSITPLAGQARVDHALTLTAQLPATLAALHAGRIDATRARVLIEELTEVDGPDPSTRADVEQHVLAGAAGQTPPRLRAACRRALLGLDPAAAERRHAARVRSRCVRARPLPDAMGELTAILTADGLMTVTTGIDALADTLTQPSDQADGGTAEAWTADQRRADALVEVFRRILDGDPLPHPAADPPDRSGDAAHTTSAASASPGPDATGECADTTRTSGSPGGRRWRPGDDLPRRHGRRPHLQVTLPLSTLLGYDSQLAELDGYGPIPADLARAIAATAATVQILGLDAATGACRHTGAVRTYRPSRTLADQVVSRDRTCRFPGCGRRAHQCDLDHTIAWPAGATCACNLAALCRHHHQLKTLKAWNCTPATGSDPPATLHWTSPAGRSYATSPPPITPPPPLDPPF